MRAGFLTLLALLGACALAGCHKAPHAPAPAWTFEPTARTISAGIEGSQSGAGSANSAGRDPSVVVRASGEVFVLMVRPAAGGGADLVLVKSEDGGDHFSPARVLNSDPGGVRSHLGGTPRLLLGPHSELYAVWAGQGGLRVARSTNYGKSFGAPANVPTGSRAPSFFDAKLTPTGALVIAWLGPVKGAPEDAGSWVSVMESEDGQTFGPPIAVAGHVCPCCRPALAADAHGRWYVAFRQIHDGARDIALASSADHGRTWTSPTLVSNDNWRIDGCPHSGAALAVAGEALYVAWYSQAEGTPRLYWTQKTLQATAFAPRRSLSADLLDANQPSLSVEDGAVFAAFQARDPHSQKGWGPLGIYVRRLEGTEAPVRAPAGEGSAGSPELASLDAGRWLVLWTERGQEGAVAMARARRTPLHAPLNGP